jgi:arylsulfatase A-like enzyme
MSPRPSAFPVLLALALLGCTPERDDPIQGPPPTVPTAPVPLPPAEQPNIVLVLIDDLGFIDLGATGSDLHLTPSIDRLADEGVRFTSAYAASSVCSPTRAALMTGLHPARIGLTDWIPGRGNLADSALHEPDWTPSLDPSLPNIATVLAAEGYRTAWHGKMHLGIQATALGFDAGVEDWSFMQQDAPDAKGVLTVTGDALDWVAEDPDTPFFVAVSHYAVHSPIYAEADTIAFYQDVLATGGAGLHDHAPYAALVDEVDRSVGVLLDALADANRLDDTVVLVTSDNGGVVPRTTNAPLRDGKASLYEGGLRVPFIVWAPGRFEPAVTDAVITSEDLLPTLAALAGADFAGDGTSFLPVLEGTSGPRPPIYFHYPHNNTPPGSFPGGVVRDGDWKLIERFGVPDSTLELYDLSTDIGETTNLADAMPDQAAALLGQLDDWRTAVGAQAMTPAP